MGHEDDTALFSDLPFFSAKNFIIVRPPPPPIKIVHCPPNRFHLSDLVSLHIDPGAGAFVDRSVSEFYHTAVLYVKPPQESYKQ